MPEYYTRVIRNQAGFPLFLTEMPKEPTTPFGTSLRKTRTGKRLTLKYVGELTGMKLLAVRRLEASPASNPTLLTLQRLAGALGVSVAELVKDVPPIAPLPIGKEGDQ
jgi:transcriptional regulator with XRE-family HTH domain